MSTLLPRRDRLSAVGRYLLTILVGNLLWESAQLPLYTIWRDGSPSDRKTLYVNPFMSLIHHRGQRHVRYVLGAMLARTAHT